MAVERGRRPSRQRTRSKVPDLRPKEERRLGHRKNSKHRAALGLSDRSDAKVTAHDAVRVGPAPGAHQAPPVCVEVQAVCNKTHGGVVDLFPGKADFFSPANSLRFDE